MTLRVITLIPILILGAVWAAFGVSVEAWCALGLLYVTYLMGRNF